MTTLGVSSGRGDPSQWHGAFDCVACGRKRLPAVEFSTNAVSKKRADPGRQISCKACTRGAAETERALAAATAKLRVKEGGDGADASAATHECAACKRSRPADAFSNKQLNQKGPGKQRCRECCDAADAADASSAKTLAEVRLTRAREASANAEKTNAPDKLGRLRARGCARSRAGDRVEAEADRRPRARRRRRFRGAAARTETARSAAEEGEPFPFGFPRRE
jgi:hypothetical protein